MNIADTSVYSPMFRFTTGTTDAVFADPGEIPEVFGLDPNFPNPFNPETQIRFRLPEETWVSITIYSVRGSEVARLTEGRMSAGTYRVSWDATRQPSGTYFCRMVAGQFTSTQRMVLLK